MENKDLKRGMEIGYIGVGQAGGNFVNEFAKVGYKVLAINTSSTDLLGLDHVHKNNQLLINIGLQGAGKNPNIGRNALEEKIDEVYALVQKVFDDVDKVYVCAGFGGGTGSGMAELLIKILIEQGYDTGAIVTLPSKVEAPRVQMVALHAFENLSEIEGITSVFVVDNKKATELLPMAGLKAKYQVINNNVVRYIDTINVMSIKPSEIAFDPSDLNVMLSARGCALVHQIEIENIDDLKNDITLSTLLKDALKNSMFVDTDFTQATSTAFLFELPEGAGYYVNDKSIERMVRELGNPFDVFVGVYDMDDKKKTGRLTIMVTGLPFPKSRLDGIANEFESNEDNYSKRFEQSASQKVQSKGSAFMNKFNKIGIQKESPQKTGESTLDRLMAKKNSLKK